jgi:SAM-dependent methyltransferase
MPVNPPGGSNPNVPSSSRVYAFGRGGKDDVEADRRAAEQAMAAVPGARESARNNRDFLGRAVRHLSQLGIRQFLDLGTGIPSQGDTHEVAQAQAPESRVVYVDNDPLVVSHARALLTSAPEGRTAYIEADVRDPRSILDHPDVLATLDFTQPIALVMVAVLMHIPDQDDPAGLVKAFAEALPQGSYLVLSHLTLDFLSEETAENYLSVTANQATRTTPRSRERIAGYFDGFELVEPGLVAVSEWRQTPFFTDTSTWMYAGVGRKL